MTNDALKPCPFCGGDADIDEFEGKLLETVFAASCNNDDCPIGHKDHGSWPTKTDALNSWNTRAALAPVDVDAGLRALDYQRDLAFIFMVAKGSKDYDETIGDRIERVQELILQLKKQNDYLAAQGYIGGGEGWQDISTIPDNLMSGVDLWDDREEKRYINCTFDLRAQAWADEKYDFVKIPTHWMPLPAAPKKED